MYSEPTIPREIHPLRYHSQALQIVSALPVPLCGRTEDPYSASDGLGTNICTVAAMDAVKSFWELLSNPTFFQALVGKAPPHWYSRALQPLLIFLVIAGLVGFVWKNLQEPVQALFNLFRRFRISPAERERIRLRHQFAEHVLRWIDLQNERDNWNPERFTDLEADYYVGNRTNLSVWARLRQPLTLGPQRIKGFAKTLATLGDRFALMEGDPGAGKTILLREIARRVCRRASVSWKSDAPVALYFNLKLLDRSSGQLVDASLIRQFVLEQINRSDNPEIARFLDQHFDDGLRDGWWYFLFDSFDEIPEVLSSEDISDVIERYSQAIFSFASDFNRCRTVLATRYFRRPKDTFQSRFRLLPLSDRQRNQLIDRSALTPDAADRLYKGIAAAGPSVRYISENPMYLGLLVEYVREGAEAPSSPHELFGRFVDKRLTEESSALRRAAVDAVTLRGFAEHIAFLITAKPGLGLNPTRDALYEQLAEPDRGRQSFDLLIELLEHLRLARGDAECNERNRARFTFSHRRFQEYFATRYVLRVADSVTDTELLFDARWRETAAVLLGSRSGQRSEAILALSRQLVGSAIAKIRGNRQFEESENQCESQSAAPDFFSWPPHCLHVFSILQDGFVDDPSRLPPDIRSGIGDVVRSGFRRGRLEDRRIALEIAGTLTNSELMPILRSAISSGSRVLEDIAYRQIKNLQFLPEDVSLWIRLTLLRWATSGEIVRDRRTILAFLSRLPDAGRVHSAANLLSRLGAIDVLVHAAFAFGILGLPWRFETRLLGILALSGSLVSRPLLLSWVFWLFGRIYTVAALRRDLPRSPIRAFFRRFTPTAPERLFLLQLYLAPILFLLAIRWWVGLLFILLLSPSRLLASPESSALALWFYLSSWAPMATAAVIGGHFTSVRWWPLLPCYPLLRLVSAPMTMMRALGRHFMKYGLWYVIGVSSYLGIMFSAFRALESIGESSLPLFGAIIIAAVGSVVVSLVLSILLWLVDWRRLQRLQAGASVIAPVDFLAALSSFRFNSFRVRFIRLVADTALVLPTDQAIEVVENLSLALDRDLARRPQEPQVSTGCDAVDQWKNRYAARNKQTRKFGLKFWGTAVLDQLSVLEQRLVEQKRLADLTRVEPGAL
jgi:hypothetical protein